MIVVIITLQLVFFRLERKSSSLPSIRVTPWPHFFPLSSFIFTSFNGVFSLQVISSASCIHFQHSFIMFLFVYCIRLSKVKIIEQFSMQISQFLLVSPFFSESSFGIMQSELLIGDIFRCLIHILVFNLWRTIIVWVSL